MKGLVILLFLFKFNVEWFNVYCCKFGIINCGFKFFIITMASGLPTGVGTLNSSIECAKKHILRLHEVAILQS